MRAEQHKSRDVSCQAEHAEHGTDNQCLLVEREARTRHLFLFPPRPPLIDPVFTAQRLHKCR